MGRRRRWPTCQRTCKVPCRLEAVRGRAGDRGEEGRGACLSGSLTAARRVCFFFGTRTALHRPPPAVHPIPVPPRRRWPSPLPTRLPVVLRRPAGRTGAHAATGAAGGDSVGREARLGGHRPSRPSSCDLASSAATAAGAASAAAATAPLLCPPPPAIVPLGRCRGCRQRKRSLAIFEDLAVLARPPARAAAAGRHFCHWRQQVLCRCAGCERWRLWRRRRATTAAIAVAGEAVAGQGGRGCQARSRWWCR